MRLPYNCRIDLIHSINKNEIPWWQPCFTTFWPLKVGTLHWKTTKMQGPFLSHTSKLNQQKQWDVVSKSAANIYRLINMISSPYFIIDQSRSTLQPKILCWASTHLLSQSLPFLQLQVWDHKIESWCLSANGFLHRTVVLIMYVFMAWRIGFDKLYNGHR